MRAGSTSVSQALAGASKPSSCARIAPTASGPSMRSRRRDALPVEEEAQEVARLDRLDLRAQPLRPYSGGCAPAGAARTTREAGAEPAVKAPRRAKPSACSAASACSMRVTLRPSGVASASARHRARALEPAAHDLGERLLGTGRALVRGRRRDLGRRRRLREEGTKERQPLGADPQLDGAACRGASRAAARRARRGAPATRGCARLPRE